MDKKIIIAIIIIFLAIVGGLFFLEREKEPAADEVFDQEEEIISAITDGIYDELEAKIIEKDRPETIKIKVYFIQIIEGQEEFVEIEREIPYTLAIGRAAIEELLKGPLPEKQAEGLSSAINEGTRLQRLEIEDSLAKADFNERLQEGVAGSAWVMAIRGQIEKTLLQFETVNQVVISINGQTEDILQP